MSSLIDAPRGADLLLSYIFPETTDLGAHTATFDVYAARNGERLLSVGMASNDFGSRLSVAGNVLSLFVGQTDIDLLPVNADDATTPSLLWFDLVVTTPVPEVCKLYGGLMRVLPLGAAIQPAGGFIDVALGGQTVTVEVAASGFDTAVLNLAQGYAEVASEAQAGALGAAALAGHLANDAGDSDVPGAPAGTRGAAFYNAQAGVAQAAATAAAVLAGHYANDAGDSDVPGAPAGARGAAFYNAQAGAAQAAAAAAAVLAGHYANDAGNVDVPGAPAGTRGAAYYSALAQVQAGVATAAAASISGAVATMPLTNYRVPLFFAADLSVPVWLESGLLNTKGFAPTLMKQVAASTLSTVGLQSVPLSNYRVPLAFDTGNKVAAWIENGLFAAKGLAPALSTMLTADVLAQTGLVSVPISSFRVPLAFDAANKVAVWVENGLLGAKGLVPSLTSALQAQVVSAAATSFAPRNAPASTALALYSDGRSLYRWKAKLATLKQTNIGKIRCVFLGDSWAEKTTIPQVMANSLYASYGNGGAGFISVDSAGDSPINGVTFSKSAGWVLYDASVLNPPTAPANGCGPDGNGISTTLASDTISIGNCVATELRIFYRKTSGTFRWNVDGSAWTTVAGDGSNNMGIVTIAGLSNTSHTLNIDTTGNSDIVSFYGFYGTLTAGNGAEVLKMGNGGITGAGILSYVSTYVSPVLANLNPDLAFVVLGTNDYRGTAPASPVGTYGNALVAIAAALQAAVPDIGIIFIAPSDTSGTAVTPLTAYRDAMCAFAIGNGFEFYNLHDEFSNWAEMNALGLFVDTLHLNNNGACLLTSRLRSRFLDL